MKLCSVPKIDMGEGMIPSGHKAAAAVANLAEVTWRMWTCLFFHISIPICHLPPPLVQMGKKTRPDSPNVHGYTPCRSTPMPFKVNGGPVLKLFFHKDESFLKL